jgi:outer membrane protein OmpA-like peptidoglycan-associated protein
MKNRNFLHTLCLVIPMTGLIFPAGSASAQEVGSLGYYGIPLEEYYDTASGKYKPEYYEWKQFLEYHLHREQCQNYQAPPAGYVMRGCQLQRLEEPVVVQAAATTSTVTEPAAPPPPPPVAAPQPVTIYFDFDKSNIRNGENEKLASIVNTIASDNTVRVIVAGHTDTAGPGSYNNWLAARRAKVVADALSAKGVQAEVIEQKSYGETDLAVSTGDNTPLQANRRTVVIFVK